MKCQVRCPCSSEVDVSSCFYEIPPSVASLFFQGVCIYKMLLSNTICKVCGINTGWWDNQDLDLFSHLSTNPHRNLVFEPRTERSFGA